ncbi:MAG: L-threonylcarbamoyladenylate synthase [Dehalococcoidia bacterium]
MTTICPIPSETCVARAVARLLAGRLAIVPTDTVYGLAADIRSDEAVSAIFGLKGRGPQYPLQLLFSPASAAMLGAYGDLTVSASRFIREVGPGPWTVIVPARPGWASPALAGGATVGVRMPDHPLVHEVVERLGAPLAATSANPAGQPSPVTAQEAVTSLAGAAHDGHPSAWWVPIALDAGPTHHRLDSTVIDCAVDPPQILREGAIDRSVVARILGVSDVQVVRSVRT